MTRERPNLDTGRVILALRGLDVGFAFGFPLILNGSWVLLIQLVARAASKPPTVGEWAAGRIATVG